MRALNWNQPHLFAIDVKCDGAIVGNLRQSHSRRGRSGRTIRTRHWMRQAPAKLVTRENGGAKFGEFFVPAGVIRMHVSIYNPANWRVRNLFDGRDELIRERRVLSIDHE